MHLRHKLGKLFRLDGLQSAWEHARRWTHPVDPGPMLAALDPARLARLRACYLGPGRAANVGDPAKFADAAYWLRLNVERAQDLRLDLGGPRRVLDLGCGAGWFLYVCRCLGHDATGLDLDENPLYRDAVALLGVRRVVGRIEPFTPLPEAGGKFDLVTAHCICFQKLPSLSKAERREWGADAWRFFLDDVRANLLRPGGQLLLDFNPRGGGVYYPAEVGRLFRREGARRFRSKVFLRGAGHPPAAV